MRTDACGRWASGDDPAAFLERPARERAARRQPATAEASRPGTQAAVPAHRGDRGPDRHPGGGARRGHCRSDGRVRLALRPQRAASGRGRAELVRLRGQRQGARGDSGGAEPYPCVTRRDQPLGSRGHRRDRRPALLLARGRRSGRDRACDGRRCPRGQSRAGWVDDHTGARSQPLSLTRADVQAKARRGVPLDQAFPAVVEGQDPDLVHEPGVLRQSRLRDRGGRGDVLLPHGEGADARTGGAARGLASGSVELRPLPQPVRGAGTAERRVARDARERRHHVVAVRAGDVAHEPRPEAGSPFQPDPRAVLLQLCPGAPTAGVWVEHRARRRPQGLHDDQSGPPESGHGCDLARTHGAHRSGVGDHLDRSAHRRDQGDGRGYAGTEGQSVQLRHQRPATAGIDVQDDRPHHRGCAGHGPVPHVVSLCAAALPARLDVQPE